MSNPTELFRKSETGEFVSAGVWYCGRCRLVARSERDATVCCPDGVCEGCGATGLKPFFYRCEACRDAKRLAEAEKLETWDGWVYWEDRGPNHGYFESVEALLEWWCDEDDDFHVIHPLPEWVYVCKAHHFCRIDPDSVLEQVEENGFEDCGDHFNGVPEFRAACAAFNAANADLKSYDPDFRRVVRVPRPEVSE